MANEFCETCKPNTKRKCANCGKKGWPINYPATCALTPRGKVRYMGEEMVKEDGLTFAAYDRDIDRTIEMPGDLPELLYFASKLAEETAEILGPINKHFFQGHPLDTEKILEEMGDRLFCFGALAKKLGSSLEEVANINKEKRLTRYPDGFTEEASRNRKAS